MTNDTIKKAIKENNRLIALERKRIELSKKKINAYKRATLILLGKAR